MMFQPKLNKYYLNQTDKAAHVYDNCSLEKRESLL